MLKNKASETIATTLTIHVKNLKRQTNIRKPTFFILLFLCKSLWPSSIHFCFLTTTKKLINSNLVTIIKAKCIQCIRAM